MTGRPMVPSEPLRRDPRTLTDLRRLASEPCGVHMREVIVSTGARRLGRALHRQAVKRGWPFAEQESGS